MNAKTLKALRGSIAKWAAVVDGTGTDNGPKDCPLCALFYGDEWTRKSSDCVGCPIARKTARKYCKGTPYEEWDEITAGADRKADTMGKVEIARAELRFLKSLLPRKK